MHYLRFLEAFVTHPPLLVKKLCMRTKCQMDIPKPISEYSGVMLGAGLHDQTRRPIIVWLKRWLPRLGCRTPTLSIVPHRVGKYPCLVLKTWSVPGHKEAIQAAVCGGRGRRNWRKRRLLPGLLHPARLSGLATGKLPE